MTQNITEGHSSRRSRASRTKQVARPVAVQPVSHAKAEPLAWAEALRIAGGDVKRLVPQTDGSVIIYNNPVR